MLDCKNCQIFFYRFLNVFFYLQILYGQKKLNSFSVLSSWKHISCDVSLFFSRRFQLLKALHRCKWPFSENLSLILDCVYLTLETFDDLTWSNTKSERREALATLYCTMTQLRPMKPPFIYIKCPQLVAHLFIKFLVQLQWWFSTIFLAETWCTMKTQYFIEYASRTSYNFFHVPLNWCWPWSGSAFLFKILNIVPGWARFALYCAKLSLSGIALFWISSWLIWYMVEVWRFGKI